MDNATKIDAAIIAKLSIFFTHLINFDRYMQCKQALLGELILFNINC